VWSETGLLSRPKLDSNVKIHTIKGCAEVLQGKNGNTSSEPPSEYPMVPVVENLQNAYSKQEIMGCCREKLYSDCMAIPDNAI